MKSENKLLAMVCCLVYCLVALFSVILFKEITSSKKQPIEEATEEIIEDETEVKSLKELCSDACLNDYEEELTDNVILQHNKREIPCYIIYALIGTESAVGKKHKKNFNKEAVSSMSCRGLTQVSKEALEDYNNHKKGNFSFNDMYDISANLEVGCWHFKRYAKYVAPDDYDSLYIIYNVGFGKYTRKNNEWVYNDDSQKWEQHKNDFYYHNGKYPPTKAKQKFSELKNYNPIKRFNDYKVYYFKLFNGH